MKMERNLETLLNVLVDAKRVFPALDLRDDSVLDAAKGLIAINSDLVCEGIFRPFDLAKDQEYHVLGLNAPSF